MDVHRRAFLKSAGGVIAASAFAGNSMAQEAAKKVRTGFIGVGNRGTSLARTALNIPEMDLVAVCDLLPQRCEALAESCAKKNLPRPACYSGDADQWKRMLDTEKLDLVIIATYWDTHAMISEEVLRRGIYVGVEVPAALTVEECWRLVDASEKYKTPCMMLENWSFRQDNLAVLNMIRQGLFGDIIHSHCAHSHDCIDHWFFNKSDGKDRWGAEYLRKYNRDYYPTHSLGPVLSWLDINVGDRFTEIYSVATVPKAINAYMADTFGADHPNAKSAYTQGDIVTSILRTAQGRTVVVNLDMQLPRPYSNRWLVQGTKGVYDEEKGGVYLKGVSPKYHQWEPAAPYIKKYNHTWWGETTMGGDGHGGTDYLELRKLVDAVLAKGPAPLDVYDSVVMSAVVALSGLSIERNSPVEFPDFTRGAWKTRKPYFAV